MLAFYRVPPPGANTPKDDVEEIRVTYSINLIPVSRKEVRSADGLLLLLDLPHELVGVAHSLLLQSVDIVDGHVSGIVDDTLSRTGGNALLGQQHSVQSGKEAGVGAERAAGLGSVADDASLVAQTGADDVIENIRVVTAQIGHTASGGCRGHAAAVTLR